MLLIRYQRTAGWAGKVSIWSRSGPSRVDSPDLGQRDGSRYPA